MIESFEAQAVISQHRGKAIVVTTMTTSREWPQITTEPDLDLPLMGAMGKTSSVGLGLALAQPARKVIVLDGDGSLLMNLGSLVTIANMAPPNLVHFVFENGIYRTTGGQPLPNAGKFSFKGLAEQAGYTNAYEFDNLDTFKEKIEAMINQTGPTFVCLKVPPYTERPPYPFPRILDQLPRFTAALQNSPL